jgi:hypothetical protein
VGGRERVGKIQGGVEGLSIVVRAKRSQTGCFLTPSAYLAVVSGLRRVSFDAS